MQTGRVLRVTVLCSGISDMRNALEEKVQERLKNKGKQRMRPKMGKMDIDYSILHDAFFKYQDKPSMTDIGDLYYEGAAAHSRTAWQIAPCMQRS